MQRSGVHLFEESISFRALHSQKKKKMNEILIPPYFHTRLNL